MAIRMFPDVRKRILLNYAIKVAEIEGLKRMTRAHIANCAKVSPALINFYFGSMPELRHTIMQEAIKRKVLPIIAQGLADRNELAMKLPVPLKLKALAHLNVGDS